MNIVLLAPPAAGKGTQAELLEQNYGLVHISSGDLLRDAASKETELGQTIKAIIAKGEFVSDELINEVLMTRLASPDCNQGFVLDGYPRNLEQAVDYETILEKLNLKLDYVFLIQVEKSLLKSRITGRRTCSTCKGIYNIYSSEMAPKEEGLCDKCHVALVQRDDDNEDSFEVRYQTYLEKTEPLIAYYRNKGLLYEVNGNINRNTTFEQIKSVLDREMN